MHEMLARFPAAVASEVSGALKELDAAAATVNLTSPWSVPLARKWDSMTFTSWINATVSLQESRTILQAMCTTFIAQSADVVSFLHILFYVSAAAGLENIIVNEQQYRVVGGTQAPPLKMAGDLGPDVVHYSSPVTLIQ